MTTMTIHPEIDLETQHSGLGCQCGRATGERCAWTGSVADTVVVEWMPEHVRASHRAAGNTGTYPANGAERLRVERSCADLLIETDGPEWARIV